MHPAYSRTRWHVLSATRQGVAFGVPCCLSIGAILIAGWLLERVANDPKLKHLLDNPLLLIIGTLGSCVGLGIYSLYLGKQLWERLGVKWQLACPACGRDFPFEWYAQPTIEGLCYPCQKRALQDLASPVENGNLALTTKDESENPYAPPATAPLPRWTPHSPYSFKSDGTSWLSHVGTIWFLLSSGWTIVLWLIVVLAIVVQWGMVARRERNLPDWFAAERDGSFRRQLSRTLLLLGISVALTAMLCMSLMSVVALQGEAVAKGYFLAAAGGFGATWVWNSWLRRGKSRFRDTTLILPSSVAPEATLTLHWPAGTEPKLSPKLQFRTTCESTLHLLVFDSLTETAVMEQTWTTSADDWMEVDIQFHDATLQDIPSSRRWFFFNTDDNVPWVVRVASVGEGIVVRGGLDNNLFG